MQCQNIVLDGHLEEENCENTLLHLPSVLCAENDHLFVGKVNGNARRASHPACISIGGKGSGIIDGIVRVEVLQLFPCWANEHIAHEEGMVSSRRNDSNIDSVTLVPSSKAID